MKCIQSRFNPCEFKQLLHVFKIKIDSWSTNTQRKEHLHIEQKDVISSPLAVFSQPVKMCVFVVQWQVCYCGTFHHLPCCRIQGIFQCQCMNIWSQAVYRLSIKTNYCVVYYFVFVFKKGQNSKMNEYFIHPIHSYVCNMVIWDIETSEEGGCTWEP